MNDQTRKPGPVCEDTIGLDSDQPVSERAANRGVEQSPGSPGQISDPTEAVVVEAGPSLLPRTRQEGRVKTWAIWITIVFGFSWLVYLLSTALLETWRENIVLALPLALISAMFAALLAFLLLREWRAFHAIDEAAALRDLLATVENDAPAYRVKDAFDPVIKRIEKVYPETIEKFRSEMGNRRTASEYISLIDNIVLAPIDRDVERIIRQSSMLSAGLVMVSPHPALDALIVTYRANSMIGRIATCYGLQPTGLSSFYLLRHTLLSALTAAAVEELGSVALEEIGAGAAGQALKFMTEGAVTGSRMYRLGRLTRRKIRPLAPA